MTTKTSVPEPEAIGNTSGGTPKGSRRSKKQAAAAVSETTARYFLGETSATTITLATELSTELEAQLASFKEDRPYYVVESWKAVPDLSNGVIAVQKRAFNNRS